MDERMSESAAEVIAGVIKQSEDDAYLHGAWNSRPEVEPQAVLDALREAGWELVRTQEPLWRTDTSKGWKILIGGEPEDVYRRGDVITVSGSASFEAEDIPDLVAALLSAVSQDGDSDA